ncbi:MAG TPA: hypothetical protein VM243_05925 [Phycisphaerae bacterium]|nr:hypothetical protein [Phycisphaerae bacterium]
MLNRHKWGRTGLCAGLGLCTLGWIGCAAGGGGGGGDGEAGGALDVNFTGAEGGNFAVGQDDEGNEYTFRASDTNQITEANIRMADGRTVKVSLDDQGRPVKFRASDNANADLIYDGNQARVRYTPATGEAEDVSDIDYKSARARLQQRRALQKDRGPASMQTNEGVNRLRNGLETFEEVVESVFDTEANPDTPLKDTPLEEPVRRIARVVDQNAVQVREVTRDRIPNVDLDRTPPEIEDLAGRTFELFDAQGFCLEGAGDEGAGPVKIRSVLTFDSNGILVTEIDRKFLFDLGLGGVDAERTINWTANTTIPLTLQGDVEFTADITPVFTGTQLDGNRRVTVERRFLADISFQVEAFTTTEARTQQLFNAAFINGELNDNILEFDLILIDLANQTRPQRLARLRYYDQNTIRPTELRFPCDSAARREGTDLECPTNADPFEFFTVEFNDRAAAVDPELARRLQYEWFVSSGYGYVEEATRFSRVATVVPTDEGLLEVSLIVSDPRVPDEFDLYECGVQVGDVTDVTVDDPQYMNCSESMNVNDPAKFWLEGGTRQLPGDGPQGATDTLVEWFVPGTSDVLVEDPFSPETWITFYETGRFEVWIAVYQPDGTELFGKCEVSVDAAGFDECEEFGWYGDGICDDFCPLPDPDCRGDAVSDWCEDAGYYGDGTCDPDCPTPDPDCDQFDWCEAAGYYGDGECDVDCPSPDPDCLGFDVCEVNGWYGDGICDNFCPSFDPDCALEPSVDDLCADLGYYGDGVCDEFCAMPDPDCTSGGGVGCFSDFDCFPGEACFGGSCVFVGGGFGTNGFGTSGFGTSG